MARGCPKMKHEKSSIPGSNVQQKNQQTGFTEKTLTALNHATIKRKALCIVGSLQIRNEQKVLHRKKQNQNCVRADGYYFLLRVALLAAIKGERIPLFSIVNPSSKNPKSIEREQSDTSHKLLQA